MESLELRQRRKNAGKGVAIAASILAAVAIGGVAVAAGGGKKKPKAPAPDEPAPDPTAPPTFPSEPTAPEPPTLPSEPSEPAPAPAPDPNALGFDLSSNWGGIPLDLRRWFARVELASGIPGLARALAVKAWQAYRAKKPYVTTAQAAEIAAASMTAPTGPLCRRCFNPADGPAATNGIDQGLAQGWPTPTDVAGWSSGSFGLLDILGSSAVWSGIHTDPYGSLPFVKLPNARAAMETYEVQLGAAMYIVWRILNSTKYSVLDPGPNAADGDSLQTWANLFSAYAGPDAYAQGKGLDAKKRFMERAIEIGIDLSQVAYPWPPGKVYKKAVWKFVARFALLQAYGKRPVVDISGGAPAPVDEPADEPAPVDEPADEPAPPSELLDLPGGVRAVVVENVAADADAPLLVVLHGRGADEQQLRSTVDPVKFAGRVAYLRGPVKVGDQFAWFDGSLSDPSPGLDAKIDTATDRVQEAIVALLAIFTHTSQLGVVGYSQGGAIAYNLAARGMFPLSDWEQQVVGGAVVIAGYLPPGLRPTGETPTFIRAIHGSLDQAVSLTRGKQTFEAFEGKSPEAKFYNVAGGTHALASMRKTVQEILAEED